MEAIKVGRCTYNNLIKTLAFVLPTNGGQAFSIIMALVIGVEVPITALQILWVNMATSITLGLIFAFEPAHEDIMQQSPRRIDKGVFGKFLSWRVFYVSTLLVVAVLANFQWENDDISSLRKLRTGSVNTLCAGQLAYVFNCRNLRKNTGSAGLFLGNKVIYIGIFLACVLQIIFTYAPPFQYVFQTEALDVKSWGKIAFWGVFVFVMVEIEKAINSLRHKALEEVNNMD
ncbi:hypothetical protein EON65_13290 [archaeon]|nr:MAG: hypothetical protein EON65_13290 [archaeon]